MDCNKEEAIRAKGIAEKKMRNRDFSGAFKVAVKAEKLFQGLENISQMITVCDVHCAAEKRLFGDELDWYAILKVKLTANEAEIKKQYRKLALQLHPDKNKFLGAVAAFQLIRDAQTTLLDQGKRSAHDMKRKVTCNGPTPAVACQASQKPNPYEAAKNNSQHQQQQPTQTGSSTGQPIFWTKCPYCRARQQYYKVVLHRSIRCQTCNKIFFAYDFGAVPQASNTSQPKDPQQRVMQSQGACKVDQGYQRNFTAENVFTAFSLNAAQTSEVGTEKVNGKRGRKQPEEDVVVDENGDVLTGKKFDSQVEQNVRTYVRRMQQVSCKENLSYEEDIVNHPKRLRKVDHPL